MNEQITALIVDDEPPARALVRRLLAPHGEIVIAGECESGLEAVVAIRDGAPDLVFLDVQMPELDGFAALAELAAETTKPLPHVIFITAYDQYAVRAFEAQALDYLLKPFDRERFEQALQRALRHIRDERSGEATTRILALLDERQRAASESYVERFVIKTDGRVFFLKAAEIEWIEAEGNYVILHVGGQRHLFRETISNLETRLDPRRFQRISRSAIVNLDGIRELQPWSRGDYQVILHDGTELKLSHRYREHLNRYLSGSL